MKVRQTKLLDFLGTPDMQLIVPVYQRVYSWTRPQLRELWDDMMASGRADSPHFLGNVFYSEEARGGEGELGAVQRLSLIDGQQRMTTITLLLCAVRNYLERPENAGLEFCEMGATELARRFLTVALPSGETACKLVLSRADAPTLRWVEGIGPRPAGEEEYSKLVVESLEWFEERMSADGFDFADLQRGIRNLYIVCVQMEEGDRPQTVFESLNAKGLPLSTPDLVRNFLLMRSEFEDKSHLYDAYWAKVEDVFSEDPDDRYLSHAIRMWTGGGANIKDDRAIFEAFKVAFSAKGAEELERRTAGLAEFCIDFHGKVASGDEATLRACREWEESRGKAERLRNDRRIFGD